MLKDAFCTRLCLLIFISIMYCSCSKKTFIFNTKQVNTTIKKDDKNYYVFENDSLRMVYTFWPKGGTMAFSIYNKLTVPLYINWKRSSLVLNFKKTDYWAEETVTRTKMSKTASVVILDSYSPLYNLMLLSSMSSAAYIQQNTIIPEKVTFIAPQSYIFKGKDGLISKPTQPKPFSWRKDYVNSLNSKGKRIKAEVVEFTESTTPIVFRNFLSVSTTEDFQHEQYIDHTFFVDKIVKVKEKDAFRTQYDKKVKKFVGTYFFYEPTDFYQRAIN